MQIGETDVNTGSENKRVFSYLVLSDICICQWLNSIERNELKVMHGALTRRYFYLFI